MDRSIQKKEVEQERYVDQKNLKKEDVHDMVSDLATMTTWEVAQKYGIDKQYETAGQARSRVYSIFSKAQRAPELYDISKEAIEVVEHSLKHRNTALDEEMNSLSKRERDDLVKTALDEIRDKSIKIMDKKLTKALRSKKERDKIKIKDIADIIGKMIDKGRLLAGESTQHVLHYARINQDISPDDALKELVKSRDKVIEEKQV